MKKLLKKILSNSPKNRECNICNSKTSHFTKYEGGSEKTPEWIKNLIIVGSDFDNFGCPTCGSHDRERHFYMYFDKLQLWDKIKNANILHFAPEKNLTSKIEKLSPSLYIKGDLFPANENIQRIDATDIPFEDSNFDFIFFNHILEHIPNYKLALKEILRVLKPNGIAILQTPYSKLLKHTFEDENINTDELRYIYYGQIDHVRVFSENDFFKSLKDAGFKLEIVKHQDLFTDQDAFYYGVNKLEDLVKVSKE